MMVPLSTLVEPVMKHRKNHAYSLFMGFVMVAMLCLMAVPLIVILLANWE